MELLTGENKMKVTKEKVNQIQENKTLILLFAKKAIQQLDIETLAPKIEKVYNTILSKYNFTDDSRRNSNSEKITDYKYLYLTNKNTDKYYIEVQKKLSDLGYTKGMPKNHCPLCVAEMEVFATDQEIFKILQTTFEINKNQYMSNENREKLIDTSKRFLSDKISKEIKKHLTK